MAIAVASQKERTALVVVNVRVAHWRAVEDQRLFQEIRVALGCVTESFEEVRDGADVVPVDLRELLDPLLSLAVMRGRVKPSVDAGLRVDTARNVLAPS